MAETLPIHLTVNGQPREGHCEPRKLLVDFLRENLGLTGTHVGCEHGICGVCTILCDGTAVRSCLMFAVQADGATRPRSRGWRATSACIRCRRPFTGIMPCSAAFARPA